MTSAILLKSAEEIQILQEANQIVALTLAMVRRNIEPGISTLQLDKLAEKFVQKKNAVPAFKGYRGFPGSLCVSINEQVVHGIPSKKVKLREGDIISIDFGVKYKGFYGDAAITVPVGSIDENTEKLIAVTRTSLQKAIAQVQSGNRISDISLAVQEYVEKNGFSVVRQFVGHGIGQNLHEPPEIPNYVRKERSPKLMPGMVLAIEPMVNAGKADVKILKDGWTVITADKKPSAHFEHSVAVTENGPLVLSLGTED
ncbi:MAG: type I methionyl aminopeptidase [Desulfovibrionaceae bacterium]|nr:type I methionyl aminopeptidase [Desulfovibrionaceae bacterium]